MDTVSPRSSIRLSSHRGNATTSTRTLPREEDFSWILSPQQLEQLSGSSARVVRDLLSRHSRAAEDLYDYSQNAQTIDTMNREVRNWKLNIDAKGRAWVGNTPLADRKALEEAKKAKALRARVGLENDITPVTDEEMQAYAEAEANLAIVTAARKSQENLIQSKMALTQIDLMDSLKQVDNEITNTRLQKIDLGSGRVIGQPHSEPYLAAERRLAVLQTAREKTRELIAQLSLYTDLGQPAPGDPLPPRLAANRRLVPEAITEIKSLKASAVYQLTGSDGSEVIVKLEPNFVQSISGEKQARERAVEHLARALIRNAPESEILEDAEVVALGLREGEQKAIPWVAQMLHPSPGGEAPPPKYRISTEHFAAMAEPNTRDKFIFKRMPYIPTGKTLEQLEQEKSPANEAAINRVFASEMLRELGRIAFFDRLVNNEDRFMSRRNDGSPLVTKRNIEFTPNGSRVLALDNFDPANEPTDVRDIRTRQARVEYATAVVDELVRDLKPSDAKRDTYKADLVNEFLAGMEAARGDLRNATQALQRLRSRQAPLSSVDATAYRTAMEAQVARMTALIGSIEG